MEVTLAGGVVVDLASRADVESHHHRLEQIMRRPGVLARRLAGGVPTPTSIVRPILLNLGRPPAGSVWAVQWIRVAGVDPVTAVANVSAVGYIGSAASAPSTIVGLGGGGDDANAFTNGLAVPSVTSVPDMTIVYPTEELYFLIVGTAGNLANAARYVVNVGVLQVPNTPEALAWL